MASYFDEHDCVPLGENERPNEQLLLARLLVDSGIATALGLNYENLSNTNGNLPPPTSKKWMETEFPKYCFDESDRAGFQCPICLLKFHSAEEQDDGAQGVRLPDCGHTFHAQCLTKWLQHTSSCPMCRQEFPTDDGNYEELKKQRKREKTRQLELDALHDSMFS